MQILSWAQFLKENNPFEGRRTAMTVGVFDGVHRGHKALIEQIAVYKKNTLPVVLAFTQSHHKKAEGPEYPGDILSLRQKTAIFESLGVLVTIVIEFTESFRQIKGSDFLKILQEHGNMSFMAVGSNFRCGYKLDTDAALIQEINSQQGIPTGIIEPLTEASRPISSSLIRTAIARGKLKTAAALLGHSYVIDAAGALMSAAGDDTVFNISGQGLILPLPGKYGVFLYKKGSPGEKVPAEIRVEGGNLLINTDLAGSHGLDYVEFQ